MNVAQDEILKLVREFVRERQGGEVDLALDTALLAEGYLDSFALVELTALVGERLGIDLDPGALLPEDYESVRTLVARLAEL